MKQQESLSVLSKSKWNRILFSAVCTRIQNMRQTFMRKKAAHHTNVIIAILEKFIAIIIIFFPVARNCDKAF